MREEEELKKGSILSCFGKKAQWKREVKLDFKKKSTLFFWLRETDVHFIYTDAAFLKLE